MATSLDMSLDDIIKSNRNSRGGRGGRGRARRGRARGAGSLSAGTGRPAGPPVRGPLGINTRPSSNAIAKSSRRPKNFPWQRDLFEDSIRAAGISGMEAGAKLYVSNLDYGVTNEDIRELFSDIGELQRYAVHYDRNGRPSGSAEVVYTRRSDAFAALKRYNNVQLDGKPMKIEIIGANADIPVTARVNVIGGANGLKRTVVMGPAGRGGSIAVRRGSGQWNRGGMRNVRGHSRGRGRGSGGRGSGGRGRGRGKKQPAETSADKLDKDLESYHAEAMQS